MSGGAGAWLPRLRRAPAVAESRYESTLSQAAWQRRRRATQRWAAWGAVVGALAALVVLAPAAWLARAVAGATDGRLLLADARGTVWSGDAVVVLTGGADSRDASALPGRLSWALRWRGSAFDLVLRHACCLNGDVALRWQPGIGRQQVTVLAPADGTIGQWPAAWLSGLGTPWNTIQLAGSMRLSSPAFGVEWVQGRLRVNGSLQLDLDHVASRLSTLDPLGSYRVVVQGDPAGGDGTAVTLSTLDGALRLNGQGMFSGGRLRFSGQAQADEGREAALSNLLNIMGRRDGARALITIG